ncbi:hypothetical protein Q5752_003704 [Cryptotrichosporon argae]
MESLDMLGLGYSTPSSRTLGQSTSSASGSSSSGLKGKSEPVNGAVKTEAIDLSGGSTSAVNSGALNQASASSSALGTEPSGFGTSTSGSGTPSYAPNSTVAGSGTDGASTPAKSRVKAELADSDRAKTPPVASSSRGKKGKKRQADSSPGPSVSQVKEERAEQEDSPPPVEEDEHYVTFKTDVVGIQYYQGLVGQHETVMLRRQPQNQYDANAVQVGHVPRAVAGHIAPLMDAKLITVEGRMIGQNTDGRKHFKLAMDVSIFARPSHRPHLEPELAWATPGGRGFDYMRKLEAGLIEPDADTVRREKANQQLQRLGGSGPSGVGLPSPKEDEVKRLLQGLKKVDGDEKQADGVMNALTADIDVTSLPLHPSPPSLANGQLMTDLLPHQSQALDWMTKHENPVLPKTATDPAVQFWVKHHDKGRDYWLNVATRTPQDATPILGRGGIIADGMGLGKTLTTLSLVLATKKDEAAPGFSGATLVVCPLSVLSNWEKQIKDHVAPGNLTSYTYHGATRDVTATTLASYDVVITTYQTVASDAGSATASPVKGKKPKVSEGALMHVKWKRVVADEGHVLKNPRAKMTQAFAALQAERRWVCTGTPIINSPADLGSLLTCLHICAPLDTPEYFRSLLIRPLASTRSYDNNAASRLLQALVGQILLRRTKNTKNKEGRTIVELPPIEYYDVAVKLDDETRRVYDRINAECARRFMEMMDEGEGQVSVLAILTRMRQMCLALDLVPQSFLDEMNGAPAAGHNAVAAVSLSQEEQDALVAKLRQVIADSEECPVCFDVLDDPRITDCGHAFCLACITTVIEVQARCPMDRHPLTAGSLLELPPDDDAPVIDTAAKTVKSAKVDELVRYLHAFAPDEKTLVFSQFTSFLDRVGKRLDDEGIKSVRFDGSMNAKQRQQVIASFQQPGRGPRVMLISLKSGAVGLNLTAASNVFLCDPWWQSAIEKQAIDRVHRMGQTKTVRVFQLIAEDTIESKVLSIQHKKDKLVSDAFAKTGKESKADKKRARFEELKAIFGVEGGRTR